MEYLQTIFLAQLQTATAINVIIPRLFLKREQIILFSISLPFSVDKFMQYSDLDI